MNKPRNIRLETVPVDVSRSAPKGDGVVLLYDHIGECYYRVEMTDVIDAALRYVRNEVASIRKEVGEFEKRVSSENEAFRAETAETQRRFIADISEANQSIIDLVKNQ